MPGSLEQEDPSPPPSPTKKKRAPNKSHLDEDNILPDTVSRRRKKTAKGEGYARGDVYTALLQHAIQGTSEVYHAAFGAFIPARKYYENEDTPPPPTPLKPVQSGTRYHRDQLPPEPQYWHHMLKHPFKDGFIGAVYTEIQDLQAKQTFEEVPASQAKEANKTPIPTTWVFKYKFDAQGYLIKFKARLCARGDLQTTEQNTYAATLAIRIFRALMAIVAFFDLETRQYDAVNAFANPDLSEPTYLYLPKGYKHIPGVLLLLHRALYGLKESAALWFQHLSETLIELGFQPVPGTECLFIHEHMMVFFYVDDIVVIYEARYVNEVEEFQSKLFKKYEMRYLGEISWFLGIRLTRDRELHKLTLCQDSYIDKITNKYNVNLSSKPPKAPLVSSDALIKNIGTATAQQILTYQQYVGSINFAATTSRGDVAFAASKLSEFLTNPSEHHSAAALRTMQYLGHTKHYSIVFDPQATDPYTTLLASSDASFADDPETRFSSQGYGFKLFDGMIDWKASKQKTVTLSSTEAELLAVTNAAKETIWWTRFFDEIQLRLGTKPYIQVDNLQTIRILTTEHSQFTSKLRHVDIHHHWLRQEVRKGNVSVKYTASAAILADGLTKALPALRHKEFIKLLGLQNIKPIAYPNSNSNPSASHPPLAAGGPPPAPKTGTNEEEDTAPDGV